MIQETLNMLLHLVAKLFDHCFLQFKKIERVMPPARVGAAGCVFTVRHQVASELFQIRVQVNRAVVALVYPGREYWQNANLGTRRRVRFTAGRTLLFRVSHHSCPLPPGPELHPNESYHTTE